MIKKFGEEYVEASTLRKLEIIILLICGIQTPTWLRGYAVTPPWAFLYFKS